MLPQPFYLASYTFPLGGENHRQTSRLLVSAEVYIFIVPSHLIEGR